jgi:8-oxo-dGTP pyrophosphatase MutT (NUDIX family)
MYKVFFKDRTVFFRDDFPETFRTKSGLFYKYESTANLAEIVNAFFHLEKINTLYLFHKDLEVLRKEFISLFKPIKAAGGLVRNSKGEFMAILRNGIWDLPKGKSEKGESASESAIREVCEECGISTPELSGYLLKTYHAYKQDGKAILKETDWFRMTVEGNVKTTPQEKENITEVRWMKPEDVSIIKSNTYPLILEVLTEAQIL